ncbi:hypothetical protein AYO38_02425 [bacterium SCGC AG-212-C10]|nr:hypothetical protein AYO38_02425 [bacterium SCGC AG-212-C10]
MTRYPGPLSGSNNRHVYCCSMNRTRLFVILIAVSIVPAGVGAAVGAWLDPTLRSVSNGVFFAGVIEMVLGIWLMSGSGANAGQANIARTQAGPMGTYAFTMLSGKTSETEAKNALRGLAAGATLAIAGAITLAVGVTGSFMSM